MPFATTKARKRIKAKRSPPSSTRRMNYQLPACSLLSQPTPLIWPMALREPWRGTAAMLE